MSNVAAFFDFVQAMVWLVVVPQPSVVVLRPVVPRKKVFYLVMQGKYLYSLTSRGFIFALKNIFRTGFFLACCSIEKVNLRIRRSRITFDAQHYK